MIQSSDLDETSSEKTREYPNVLALAKRRATRAVLISGQHNVDMNKMRSKAKKEFESDANIYIEQYEKSYKEALAKVDSTFIARHLGTKRGADAVKKGRPINLTLLHEKAKKEFKKDAAVDEYVHAYVVAFEARKKLNQSKIGELPPVIPAAAQSSRPRDSTKALPEMPAKKVPSLTPTVADDVTKSKKSSLVEASNEVVNSDEFILVSRAKITNLFDELRKLKETAPQPSNHQRRQLRHSR
ncbi:MAG: hypothetical protein JSR17_03655 [Proteobacteria bacterium]|nr:hypothetical protein [Pseudomonadota bacterium]